MRGMKKSFLGVLVLSFVDFNITYGLKCQINTRQVLNTFMLTKDTAVGETRQIVSERSGNKIYQN